MAKRASKVPANETPRQRFQRVAGSRLGNVVANLENVGKLRKGEKTYDFSQADIDKIRAGITAKLDDACRSMEKSLTATAKSGGRTAKIFEL